MDFPSYQFVLDIHCEWRLIIYQENNIDHILCDVCEMDIRKIM